MQVHESDGRAIDAHFDIEATAQGGVELVFHCRGPKRNTQYAEGLYVLLRRLGESGVVVRDALLDARPTRHLPRGERRLRIGNDFPVALAHADAADVADRLRKVAATLARAPGATGGGNTTRTLRLILSGADEHTVKAAVDAVSEPEPIEPTSDFDRLTRLTQRVMKGGTVLRPTGQRKPEQAPSNRVDYKRDPQVRAYVLAVANGRCECCGGEAPFSDGQGQPYLEVHHARWLAKGGSDTVENSVAVCPNCHARLHHGADAELLVEQLYAQVDRLERAEAALRGENGAESSSLGASAR